MKHQRQTTQQQTITEEKNPETKETIKKTVHSKIFRLSLRKYIAPTIASEEHGNFTVQPLAHIDTKLHTLFPHLYPVHDDSLSFLDAYITVDEEIR